MGSLRGLGTRSRKVSIVQKGFWLRLGLSIALEDGGALFFDVVRKEAAGAGDARREKQIILSIIPVVVDGNTGEFVCFSPKLFSCIVKYM